MPNIPRIDVDTSSPLTAEQLKAVADLLGGDVIIAYRPYFAHAFGGAANAVLLSQFWFWTNTPTCRNRDGAWFWKSQAEITEETGLTRREILTARRDLAALGVLSEDVRGVPATVHYSVNKDAVYARLWAYIASRRQFAQNVQTDSPETCKVVRGKRANKPARSVRTITETSPEISSKKKQNQEVLPSAVSRDKTPEQSAVYKKGAQKIKAALEAAKKGGQS